MGAGAHEAAGHDRDRISGAPAADRKRPPRNAREHHEHAADERWGGQPGQDQPDHAGKRARHAGEAPGPEPFPAPEAVAEHRCLHGAEEEQRASPRGQADVGEREAGGIGEQPKRGGQGGGIDAGLLQREPAQQRVPREREHR
jgi:hypothetical protein